jgi:fermentation-respiration switch protein FrsA (DUF1100 family)
MIAGISCLETEITRTGAASHIAVKSHCTRHNKRSAYMPSAANELYSRRPLPRCGRYAGVLWVSALVVSTGYLAACGALWHWQSHIVFEPDRVLHSKPADYRFPVVDVRMPLTGAASEPQYLHGWWIPGTQRDAKTVLYLHGNDGNVSTNMAGIEPLRQIGLSVFMLDYRGYGESGGEFPSEAGVYQDAQTAWNYLVATRRVKPADLLIYGHSLGGAIAIELAAHHPEAAGLVVEGGFTSIRDMARLEPRFAVFPLGVIINQRFDSISKVKQLRLPTLYVHGVADEVVPYDMGKALYRATDMSIRKILAIPDSGHEESAILGGKQFRAAITEFSHQTKR